VLPWYHVGEGNEVKRDVEIMDRHRETQQMPRNLRNEDVSTKRRRIARLAEQSPELGFTSLNHLIDMYWLAEAFRLTRKSGAPGVDGQTAKEYEENLEENLRSLHRRANSGTYRAPLVRRKHIPKGTGKETRPICSASPTTGASRARATGR